MLIPLGHEQTSVRRLPWVTFSIMATCVVVFILALPGELRKEVEAYVRLHHALGYFTQHPYLEMDPRFEDVFFYELGEEQAAAFSKYMRESGPQPPDDEQRLAYEQYKLDRIVAVYFQSVDSSFLSRYGLVPADLKPLDFVTYQFLHAGWIHILFNLLFLFLSGPFIEDVWGRPLFAGFYLTAGAFAGLMFSIRFPDMMTPLVGASGAIAAVMGAFLVRFVKARIRFVLWVFVPLGPFQAPAWIILPWWFAIQLREAVIPDASGGVGFWAHVWGFVFGVIFALGMSYFRVEDRLINEAIESKVKVVDNTLVDRALTMAEKGDSDAALAALEREIKTRPENVEASMALWNLCVQRNEIQRGLPFILSVIEKVIRGTDHQFAMNQWESLLELDPNELDVEPLLAVRLAEILEADRRIDSCLQTLDLARARSDDQTPVAVVLKTARLALLTESPQTLAMIDDALNHPEIPQNARPELEVARWALTQGKTAVGKPAEGPGADEQEDLRYLQVTVAVPIAVNDRMLSVDVRGAHRQVVFETVTAVAVAGIARSGRRPVAVVDLLLDPLSSDVTDPRTIRLFGDSFDPRNLVGGADPRKAFREFLSLLIDSTNAEALPNTDAAKANPFHSYPSLEAYELDVFGVAS